VIARGGADAVTHRAVAAEAGVALASTTYHFASKSALVREALELVIERSTALVRRHTAASGRLDGDQLVDRLLVLVAALCDHQGAPLAAEYELMLEAGRRSELQPLAERWNKAYLAGLVSLMRCAGLTQPEQAGEIISNLIEGALLNQLALPRAGFVQGPLRAMLERVVAGFQGPAVAPGN
jgi:DNA-binding transcriptional regulator YbjK